VTSGLDHKKTIFSPITLALGSQQVESGEVAPVSEVVKRLRSKVTTT